MPRFLSVAKKVVIAAFVAYLVAFVAVVLNQRALIFHPAQGGNRTPADYGVPFDSIFIPNNQGEKIAAWWIHHTDGLPHPTLVYCHGNAASLASYSKVASIFYNLGWDALLFDYRGFGHSDPASEGISEGSVAVDAEAAYQWVSAKVSERSIFVWGHSLGSSIAARLASQHHPAGLVLEGAFSSLYAVATRHYPYFPILPFMLFDSFATAQYLQGRTFPILEMHSERDVIIPLNIGQELFNQLESPKQWLLIKGVGHNDFPEVHAQYDELIKEVVKRWMQTVETGDISPAASQH